MARGLTFSRPHPSKPRNGVAVQVLETEQAVLAIIAKGDPTRPCDWKAAETAVQTSMAYLKDQESNWQQVFEGAIEAALKAVNELYGICKGAKVGIGLLMATSDRLYWRNAGSGFLTSPDGAIPEGWQITPPGGLLLINQTIIQPDYWLEILNQTDPDHQKQQLETLSAGIDGDIGLVYIKTY